MLENNFITLAGAYPEHLVCCGDVKEISKGESFLCGIGTGSSVVGVYLLLGSEDNIYSIPFETFTDAASGMRFVYVKVENASDGLNYGNGEECWINLQTKVGNRITSLYSPAYIWRVNTDGLSKVVYKCDNDAFGWPFKALGDKELCTWLPVNLKNPQLKQDDKTYVKQNGEVEVLYANYYKEWEAESEYLTEASHDKICAILSCDHVWINGVKLTKSDSYEIDWSNTIKEACGQKRAKATWKMRANVMSRNSNI